MKIFSLFRNWFARTVGNDPRKRQILYAWLAALVVIALMSAPALAQSGITFYTGLGVVTFGVYQNILSGTVTPQAATTTVALDYEICGQ